MVFQIDGDDEASHWAHIMCDPEYKSIPSSNSRGEKLKIDYGCNGCEPESLSQIRGVFVNCVGIACFRGDAYSNVGEALIGFVQIGADPNSVSTQTRATNVP